MEIEHIQGYLWTPVRTRPRREKKLAEYCAANKITHYLPLRRSVRRYNRRTVEFLVPMFSGYIFCCLNPAGNQKIILSNAFAYKIQMHEKTEEILIEELKSICVMENVFQKIDIIIRPELVSGSKIIVRNGPLKGMSGVVERRKGKTTISINIEILGQSASTEVDVEDLDMDE